MQFLGINNVLTMIQMIRMIWSSIHYRCVPGQQKPAFVGLAEFRDPLHKQHGLRIFTHNPEVSDSLERTPGQANPIPNTRRYTKYKPLCFIVYLVY
jgi:hypothetical protein